MATTKVASSTLLYFLVLTKMSPVIILTGASRGLGLAVLRILLTKHNARVATLSRSLTPELQGAVDEYGADRVLPVQGDVSKPEDNAQVVKEAVDKWGQLDGLVLNAGSIDPVGMYGPLAYEHLVTLHSQNWERSTGCSCSIRPN